MVKIWVKKRPTFAIRVKAALFSVFSPSILLVRSASILQLIEHQCEKEESCNASQAYRGKGREQDACG